MSANSEKLIRKQFLVSPATARRLERLAAASGTSASEIVRQAINAFEVNVAKTLRLLDESA
jgi:predicted transcriptional regulator